MSSPTTPARALPLLLGLSCRISPPLPAPPAPPAATAPDTAASTPTEPTAGFGGIAAVVWDGADGLTASWELLDTAERYTLWVVSRDGEPITSLDTQADTALISGLADGEYRLWVDAHLDTGKTTDGGVSIDQLVGENRVVYRSEVALPGAMDVWGQGDIHVIAGGRHPDIGVLVVDTQDPENPEILATLNDIGFVRDIKIGDGLLFTAVDPDSDGCELCDDIGVRIFDFSDPSDPQLLSEIGAPDTDIHNVSYADGYLYLTSISAQAVSIYDVTDPTRPERVGLWEADLQGAPQRMHDSGSTSPHDQLVVDGTMYVAHLMGFSIVDVSDPTQPVDLVHQIVSYGGHNIWPTPDGQHVLTTQEIVGGHLRIWDVSDLSSFEEVSSYSTGDDHCVHNVLVEGETAYAAWYVDGLLVFDLSSPNEPVLVGWYDTFDGDWSLAKNPVNGQPMPAILGAWGVWASGSHLAIGDTQRGLIIVDYIPREVRAAP